ncbi:helix-turn-helix domain-containing protein [Burkholderia sp. Bp9012]|uniref:helix-turn-helix domain-containing protein n=1 Tax=Burkholderia sp. Bp9012 TaxID=2184562 RepID=UPI001623EEE2|nr:helix-turn-helix domain-containing protein [Burkholderia sp. Bp9012]
MEESARLTTRRFTTEGVAPKERYDAWIGTSAFYDMTRTAHDADLLEARSQHVTIGPLIIASRTLHGPATHPLYHATRTPSRLRADGHDFHCFNLQLEGQLALRSDDAASIKQVGEMYLLDSAQAFECAISAGSEVAVAVPRFLLPTSTERLHGTSLNAGVAGLIADHILSLHRRWHTLTWVDVPHVVHATIQLLSAAIHRHLEPTGSQRFEPGDVTRYRVQHFINEHLVEVSLTPERICQEVGVSRAKLYQLYESAGGVMRAIRRQRLVQAHRTLCSPAGRHLRIAEVAWQYGFTDEKYFSRVFKMEFGYSPRDAATITTVTDFAQRADVQRIDDPGNPPSD